MKHIKKFNEGFREEMQEVFSKARILYPKLANQEGGDNTFWYKTKAGEKWLTFELRYGDEGVSYPLAKFEDILSDGFKPEDISASDIIKWGFE